MIRGRRGGRPQRAAPVAASGSGVGVCAQQVWGRMWCAAASPLQRRSGTQAPVDGWTGFEAGDCAVSVWGMRVGACTVLAGSFRFQTLKPQSPVGLGFALHAGLRSAGAPCLLGRCTARVARDGCVLYMQDISQDWVCVCVTQDVWRVQPCVCFRPEGYLPQHMYRQAVCPYGGPLPRCCWQQTADQSCHQLRSGLRPGQSCFGELLPAATGRL
jgi:hypothetical protein